MEEMSATTSSLLLLTESCTRRCSGKHIDLTTSRIVSCVAIQPGTKWTTELSRHSDCVGTKPTEAKRERGIERGGRERGREGEVGREREGERERRVEGEREGGERERERESMERGGGGRERESV